jgi:hypothetical protein
MMDKLGFEDVLQFVKEESHMRVIEVALAYQRMLMTIYEAIHAKKWNHKAKAASAKAKIQCNDCDFPLRQQYEAEMHHADQIQKALDAIKEYVNMAYAHIYLKN